MKEEVKLVLTLVVISVLSAASLSFVYGLTRLQIEQNKLDELRDSLNEVMPAEYFEERQISSDKISTLYDAFDSDKNKVGAVILTQRGGYQSDIKILVGIDTNKKEITAIKIIEQLETPGLGARIGEPDFTGQFSGQALENQEVDAITGATISSSAVIDAVKESAAEFLSLAEG